MQFLKFTSKYLIKLIIYVKKYFRGWSVYSMPEMIFKCLFI